MARRLLLRSVAVPALTCAVALIIAPGVVAQADLRLIDALEHRDVKNASALLERHIDVNVQRPDGVTALHWAVYWDDLPFAQRLLKSGARASVANELGVTPLGLASANG